MSDEIKKKLEIELEAGRALAGKLDAERKGKPDIAKQDEDRNNRSVFPFLDAEKNPKRFEPKNPLPVPKPLKPEHHGFDYLLGGVGLIVGYLGQRYGSSWLAASGGGLLWFAFYEYTKYGLSSKSALRRYATWTVPALVIGVGTIILVRQLVPQKKTASQTTSQPNQPVPSGPLTEAQEASEGLTQPGTSRNGESGTSKSQPSSAHSQTSINFDSDSPSQLNDESKVMINVLRNLTNEWSSQMAIYTRDLGDPDTYKFSGRTPMDASQAAATKNRLEKVEATYNDQEVQKLRSVLPRLCGLRTAILAQLGPSDADSFRTDTYERDICANISTRNLKIRDGFNLREDMNQMQIKLQALIDGQ